MTMQTFCGVFLCLVSPTLTVSSCRMMFMKLDGHTVGPLGYTDGQCFLLSLCTHDCSCDKRKFSSENSLTDDNKKELTVVLV